MNASYTKIQALINKGNFHRAKQLCEVACRENPGDSNYWALLGESSFSQGLFVEARQQLQQALRLNRGNAEAMVTLGRCFLGQNMPNEAISCFMSSAQAEPAFINAFEYLSKVLVQIDRSGDAIKPALRWAELDANSNEAKKFLARIFLSINRHDETELWCRKALEQREAAETYYILGCSLLQRNRSESALASFKKALELDCRYADAYRRIGDLYREKHMLLLAKSSYEEALRHAPALNAIRYEIAAINLAQGDKTSADNIITKLDSSDTDKTINVYLEYGIVLQSRGLLEEAENHFRKAIKLSPPDIRANMLLGVVLHAQGKLDEAISIYNCILNNHPENPEARWNRAQIYLLKGNFDSGWSDYHWKWKCGGCSGPKLPIPEWDGQDLHDKTILVYEDQGVGDQIMFCSCIPDLMQIANHVVIQGDRRFRVLFEDSFPNATINPAERQGADACIDVNAHIPMSGLPKYLRKAVGDYPKTISYLVPEPGRVAEWRRRYNDLGKGIKIGISWRGGAVSQTQVLRSIALPDWIKLLKVTDAHFINLQYGDCSEDIDRVKDQHNVSIHDWPDSDPLRSLDDFCAKIAALDLVISVDNSTVHFAAALGKEVWTLLPLVPDWRWLLNSETSYWYPTMRLYRQRKAGHWSDVFSRLMQDLEKFAPRK